MDNGTRIGVGGTSMMNGADARMTNGSLTGSSSTTTTTTDAMRLQQQQQHYARRDHSNYSNNNNINTNNNINNNNNNSITNNTINNRDGFQTNAPGNPVDLESQNKRVSDILTTDVMSFPEQELVV